MEGHSLIVKIIVWFQSSTLEFLYCEDKVDEKEADTTLHNCKLIGGRLRVLKEGTIRVILLLGVVHK